MDGCLTCDMFNQFDQLAQSYGRDAFDVIAPAAKLAFNAYVGAWVAWVLIYNGIIRADLNVQTLVPRILTITVCSIVLNGVDLYWDWIYQPTYDAMNQLATSLVVKSSTGIDVRTLAGMLGSVETRILNVLGLCVTIWNDGGLTALGLIIAALVLSLPYLFVWGIFMAFVLEGVFKLLAITSVAPLLIVAAAFPATRGFAISGMRVVLGGVLTVIFAAVAMGFTLSVLDTFMNTLPMTGGSFNQGAAAFVKSKEYWAAIILGFVSVLFHLKAATLAANISGASDGPGAAAAVVAGGMSAFATVKGFAFKRSGDVAHNAASAAVQIRDGMHDRIWGKKPTTSGN
jgi:TrbL/VirB6 plasmid conjugal transfer protein